MSDQTTEFREKREHLLLRLLVRLTRQMSMDTVARMQKRGVQGMQPTYVRLLGNLDTEGTRVGGLARRMGTTRQAVTQLAKEIEKAGFVERLSDPLDGRGVIVCFTRKGRRTLGIAVEVMTEIDTQYAALLPAGGLETLKTLMASILDQTDVQGTFGLD